MKHDKIAKSISDALEYHQRDRPGKLAIRATKPLSSQRDLSLAYSPGVAEASTAIAKTPSDAMKYTARGNLVAVISNGSAVLGLGNIGALASKPVMEGKAVLFKTFADIDCFDIEVDESDPDLLADTIRRLGPTFGGINLEDIKAPDCFVVEGRLRKEMDIPVFHDDQHGTAIVVGAAVFNSMRLVGKDLSRCKIVSTGGGAAGIACLNLLVDMGAKRENIWLIDHEGLVYEGREADAQKTAFAQATDARELGDVIDDADIFLGLSAPGVLKPDQVKRMAVSPLILALANPNPEILPEEVLAARSDAIIATGRTDYPNQVNNVLCFPFIFRGALDVGATEINEAMKVACVEAIANLTHDGASDEVAQAYGNQSLVFGPNYILPKPFDSRLLVSIAPAVAKAAMESGVATKPIADLEAYRTDLARFVNRSAPLMRPVVATARTTPRRVVFAEGEDPRVLRAVRDILKEGVAKPILTGRLDEIKNQVDHLGLGFVPGADVDVFDHSDPGIAQNYGAPFHSLRARDGVTPEQARKLIRSSDTLASALHVHLGHADAVICGTSGAFTDHLKRLEQVFGANRDDNIFATLVPVLLEQRTVFVSDGYVNSDPTAAEIASICRMAADQVRQFGVKPRVALIGHASFGAHPTATTIKMREATAHLAAADVDFEFEGEMRLNLAFDKAERDRVLPCGRLTDDANVLVFPNLDAANAAINALKSLTEAETVGPFLLGLKGAAHVVTPSVTARGLFNIAALASATSRQTSGGEAYLSGSSK
ncbi:MAG: NADP-dependent malic enzyme [Shimia sp.]|nr:NADP-dependent malic enzyme [Shimia sp.]MCP4818473.1 NADP-dependent malic enzyme [Shimia sp.]